MSSIRALRQKALEAEQLKIKPFISFDEEGEHRLRIIPNKFEKELLFSHFYIYYPNKGMVTEMTISPKSFGQRDPIDEFCKEQIRNGSLSKDEFKRISSLRPVPVYLVPVIKRIGDEDSSFDAKTGVKWLLLSGGYPDKPPYDLSSGQYGRLMSSFLKQTKRMPDLSPEDWESLDLLVDVVPKEKSNTGYKKIEYDFDTVVTPALTDKSKWKELIASVEDPKKFFNIPTEEELMGYLEAFVSKQSDSTSSSDDEEKDVEELKLSRRNRTSSKTEELNEEEILKQADSIFGEDEDGDEDDASYTTSKTVLENDDDDDNPF